MMWGLNVAVNTYHESVPKADFHSNMFIYRAIMADSKNNLEVRIFQLPVAIWRRKTV